MLVPGISNGGIFGYGTLREVATGGYKGVHKVATETDWDTIDDGGDKKVKLRRAVRYISVLY